MRTILLALLLVATATLFACAEPDVAVPTAPTPRASDPAEPTLPLASPEASSDTLRVAIHPLRCANPLMPQHGSSAGLFHLVYESLYDFDHEGRLVPVLAADHRWDDHDLTCRIELRPDHYFHNGRAVTVQDVKASIEAFLTLNGYADRAPSEVASEEEPEDVPLETVPNVVPTTKKHDDADALPDDTFIESYRFDPRGYSPIWRMQQAAYANIASIAIDGSEGLVIRLHAPDRTLLSYLTMAVVPRERAMDRGLSPIEGSGPWSVMSASSDDGLVLECMKTGGMIRRIEARSFASIERAAGAFEAGDVDLLWMDSQETGRFAERSRIRKQRIDEPEFVSLFFSQSRGRGLSHRDGLASAMAADPRDADSAAPFDRAHHALMSGDARRQGRLEPPVVTDDALGALDHDAAGAPDAESFVLLVPESFSMTRWLDHLAGRLAERGQTLDVERVAPSHWWQRLADGHYDAALMWDISGRTLDPADYYDALAEAGLFSWTAHVDAGDREMLVTARRRMLDPGDAALPDPTRYMRSLEASLTRVPILGWTTPSSMIWYGENVEGTLAGMWQSPYGNVEDLIVWRP
ncbi:MAG: ABC transporter substrate-binding protein [Saccharofermentanales bacterium]|jgi:hypothetical protein